MMRISAAIEQIEEIIKRLPTQKLEILLEIAKDIEQEYILDIELGKAEIERGEWVDWDDLKRELDL